MFSAGAFARVIFQSDKFSSPGPRGKCETFFVGGFRRSTAKPGGGGNRNNAFLIFTPTPSPFGATPPMEGNYWMAAGPILGREKVIPFTV